MFIPFFIDMMIRICLSDRYPIVRKYKIWRLKLERPVVKYTGYMWLYKKDTTGFLMLLAAACWT